MKKAIKKTNKKVVKEVASVKDVAEKEIVTKKLSKITKVSLIGLVVLLALVGVCFYKFGIVATVNGKPIYRMAYIKALQKADTSVLNQMIQSALIEGEAKNKNVTVSREELDESLKTIEDQIKSQGSTMEEALKSENMTKEQLEEQIRTQKIAEKLASISAEITQEQIDTFLKENKDYLSKTATKEELQKIAKEQLESQAKNAAINDWFTKLKESAKIIYR